MSHLYLCCWAIHLVLINAGCWCPGRFRPGRPGYQHRRVLADGPRGSPPPRVPFPALWNRKGAPTAAAPCPLPPAGRAPFQSHVEASRHARGTGARTPPGDRDPLDSPMKRGHEKPPCVMETGGAHFAGPPSRPVAPSGRGAPRGGSTSGFRHPLPSALSPQSRWGLGSRHASQPAGMRVPTSGRLAGLGLSLDLGGAVRAVTGAAAETH